MRSHLQARVVGAQPVVDVIVMPRETGLVLNLGQELSKGASLLAWQVATTKGGSMAAEAEQHSAFSASQELGIWLH